MGKPLVYNVRHCHPLIKHHSPQRGCALQPRVGAAPTLGNRAQKPSNPNGVVPRASPSPTTRHSPLFSAQSPKPKACLVPFRFFLRFIILNSSFAPTSPFPPSRLPAFPLSRFPLLTRPPPPRRAARPRLGKPHALASSWPPSTNQTKG